MQTYKNIAVSLSVVDLFYILKAGHQPCFVNTFRGLFLKRHTKYVPNDPEFSAENSWTGWMRSNPSLAADSSKMVTKTQRKESMCLSSWSLSDSLRIKRWKQWFPIRPRRNIYSFKICFVVVFVFPVCRRTYFLFPCLFLFLQTNSQILPNTRGIKQTTAETGKTDFHFSPFNCSLTVDL